MKENKDRCYDDQQAREVIGRTVIPQALRPVPRRDNRPHVAHQPADNIFAARDQVRTLELHTDRDEDRQNGTAENRPHHSGTNLRDCIYAGRIVVAQFV